MNNVEIDRNGSLTLKNLKIYLHNISRPAKGGGGGRGGKIPGPGLVRGLEIVVKRLVMGATVKRVGGRNL